MNDLLIEGTMTQFFCHCVICCFVIAMPCFETAYSHIIIKSGSHRKQTLHITRPSCFSVFHDASSSTWCHSSPGDGAARRCLLLRSSAIKLCIYWSVASINQKPESAFHVPGRNHVFWMFKRGKHNFAWKFDCTISGYRNHFMVE